MNQKQTHPLNMQVKEGIKTSRPFWHNTLTPNVSIKKHEKYFRHLNGSNTLEKGFMAVTFLAHFLSK